MRKIYILCNLNYSGSNNEIRHYISINKSNSLDPYFITGLTEAEGSFSIRKNKDSRTKSGLTIGLRFKLTMLDNELELLNQVKSYFGVGKIYISSKGVVDYIVQDLDGLKKIVNHFQNYPLRGTKYLDFIDFVKVLDMIENKIHNTNEGRSTIVEISLGMNRYRNEFPIPKYTIKTNPEYIPINGHYINGFIAGDGSFFLKTKTNFSAMGIQISQHINNVPLIKEIAEYFNTSIPISNHGENSIQITISGDKLWKDVISIHFLKYPMHGSKFIQLCKLNEIAIFKQNGKHLIKVGKTKVFSQEAKDFILSIWNK